MQRKKNNSSPFVFSTDPTFTPPPGDEADSKSLLPAEQKIRVILNTKHRGGKAVTLVENFQGTKLEEEQLGKSLKIFCGTGGTVKDGEILIQGDNRDKVLQWLHKNGYSMAKKV